jgi:hypothetical protein
MEAPLLTLAESQLAPAALPALCAGERDAVEVLRRFSAPPRDGRSAGPLAVRLSPACDFSRGEK